MWTSSSARHSHKSLPTILKYIEFSDSNLCAVYANNPGAKPSYSIFISVGTSSTKSAILNLQFPADEVSAEYSVALSNIFFQTVSATRFRCHFARLLVERAINF